MNGKLHRVEIEQKSYFIQLTSRNNEYDVSFTDGTTCWRGSITDDEIQKCTSELNMKYDEYILHMKHALCGVDKSSNSDVFEYVLKTTDESISLEWKKVDGEIKYCMGSISLQCMNSSSAMQTILGVCSSLMDKMCQDNVELQRKCENFEKHVQECNTSLKACLELKETQEEQLMTKFVLVINEKKRKIRELHSELKLKSSKLNQNTEIQNKEPMETKSTQTLKPNKVLRRSLDDNSEEMILHTKRKRTKQPLQIQVSPIKVTQQKNADVSLPSGVSNSEDDSTVNASDLIEEFT